MFLMIEIGETPKVQYLLEYNLYKRTAYLAFVQLNNSTFLIKMLGDLQETIFPVNFPKIIMLIFHLN